MTELYFEENEDKRRDVKQFSETLDDIEAHGFIGQSLEEMDVMRKEKYLGRHRCLYQNKKGDVVLTLGPHWYMYVIGMLFIIVMGVLTIYNYWHLITTFKKVALVLLLTSECTLYSITALLNPGIKSRLVPDFGDTTVYCKKCFTTKQEKVRHCPDCDVCIELHDHHCIWTGKCIGRGNYVPFILFVVNTPGYFITLFMIFGENS